MNKQISYIFNSKLFRILTFLGLFFFLTNTVFSRFVKPSKEKALDVNLKTIQNKDFDVVFMSNSYQFTVYDPLLLNSLTGLNSIHLGTSARRLYFEPYILKQVLRYQEPRLVVFDISTASLYIPKSDAMWYFNLEALNKLPVSLYKILMFNEIIPDNRTDLWLQGLCNTSHNLQGLTQEKKITYYNNETNGYNSGKTLGFDSRIKQNKKKLEIYEKNFDSIYGLSTSGESLPVDFEKILEKKFLEINEIASEYPNIEFLFTHNVKLNSSTQQQLSIDLIRKITNSVSNIKILELNSKKVKQELALKFKDFYDPGHLMQSGSLKVTSYFSDYLIKNYDFLNVNKKNDIGYVFKIKGSQDVLKIKDIKVLFADNYSTDIRVVVDSIPEGFSEVNTVLSIYPKEKFKHLLEDKSKKNKWKSDNAYRKFKNYLQIKDGYVGKLNSWSKLKPEHIDRVEIKFLGAGITTETKVLDLNKVNIFQAK